MSVTIERDDAQRRVDPPPHVNNASVGASAPAPSPAAPARPAAPLPDRSIRIPLMKPMRAHDGERTELILREPTVGDIEQYGLPVTLDFKQGARPAFDPPKMTMMLAALGNVTEREIRAMDPRDWSTAAWSIAPFFVPDFKIL